MKYILRLNNKYVINIITRQSCRNHGELSEKKKGDDVKGWHIVPYKENEKELRKKWLHALKRDPPYAENFKNFVVCGLHFDDNSFKRDLRHELCGGRYAFVLLEDAVPSVFTFSTSVEKRVLSERRAGKRKQLSDVNKFCPPCSSREHISEVPLEPTYSSSNSVTILSSKFSLLCLR